MQLTNIALSLNWPQQQHSQYFISFANCGGSDKTLVMEHMVIQVIQR